MSTKNINSLSECLIDTNCIRLDWEFKNPRNSYIRLIDIASKLPRTTVLEESGNYWHGLVRSLIFRFPDDLEILLIETKGIIQVKSTSRVGLSDFGVNRNRLEKLYRKLIDNME